MIEILNPGWISFPVDRGRYGFAHIGVPASAALDSYAFDMANRLTGSLPNTPVLEVIGSGFAFRTGVAVWCAVTGAKVAASVDDSPVLPWTPFLAPEGSSFSVTAVKEGLRYYIGFSGTLVLQRIMGSHATNLECRFGGFRGRPLMKGDCLELKDVRQYDTPRSPGAEIREMNPPHLLRVVEGPEFDYFTKESRSRFSMQAGDGGGFTVSGRLNRTAIRLEGKPLTFRKTAGKSIVSEGILPGTVQIPGDGLPIITLYERTIGGYARIGVVVRADRDLLAHLKPKDKVSFKLITPEEAGKLERLPLCCSEM